MTFSPEWDQLYRDNTHMSIWPWSDLVSYVHRYAKPTHGFQRVLELGCGAGANIPLFLKLGVDYHAIEGSPTIVDTLLQTYPELKGRLVVGDFTAAIPPQGPFDLVVDRVSLPHNTTHDIQRSLEMISEKLRGGGKFIGIDWFSAAHLDATRGEAMDAHTRRNLPFGSHLAGTGAVHFFDEGHLIELLTGAGFSIERLEHKTSTALIPSGQGSLAWWNFVAVKP